MRKNEHLTEILSFLFFPCIPFGPLPEAEEYVVEGKTKALHLRPSDGFP